MRNAEERNQLLEQITELERNSINYFDVEKEFFLIDSNNLAKVKTRLYGYFIQRDGIYEEDNLTSEAVTGLDGRGCYVYVDVKDDKITIKQDLNGSWGIYLFRHGDYFALSNSLFRLLDHVKFKYPLTVNRDYFHHLFIARIFTHSETIVNEIQYVDRSTIIYIDKTKQTLETKLINYKEYTVPLDSEDGIAILDRWIDFWSDFFCGLTQKTDFFTVELSGGFDSRLSLVPILYSGIDLSKIRFYSREGTLHTYSEDYKIASKIAAHYGFSLNKPLALSKFLNYSLYDVFNIDLYINQTFDKIVSFGAQKSVEKSYVVGGLGGEAVRGYWMGSPKEFINNTKGISSDLSSDLSHETFASISNILKSTFRDICNKYQIKDSDSPEILNYLYVESACPTHFGKHMALSYFREEFYISPIIDPHLRTLKINSTECPDYKLLISLIFTRYAPDLLTFPFNSGHFIAPETIAYAQKINERFPICHKKGNNLNGGGDFIYSHAIYGQRKSSPKARTIPNFPETCLKLA